MQDESIIAKRVKQLLYFVLIWFVVSGLLALYMWVWWGGLPKSKHPWVLIIVFGLYIVGESFFDWLYLRKRGRKISRRQVSIIRVVLALVFIGFSVWVGWVFD